MKLAKLVPRLATDFHGEAVATVAAIERVLSAEGNDLHDLAALIIEPRPEPPAAAPDQHPQAPQASWRRPAERPAVRQHSGADLARAAWLEVCMQAGAFPGAFRLPKFILKRCDECRERWDFLRVAERKFIGSISLTLANLRSARETAFAG